jgi:hypothetical protein
MIYPYFFITENLELEEDTYESDSQ